MDVHPRVNHIQVCPRVHSQSYDRRRTSARLSVSGIGGRNAVLRHIRRPVWTTNAHPDVYILIVILGKPSTTLNQSKYFLIVLYMRQKYLERI